MLGEYIGERVLIGAFERHVDVIAGLQKQRHFGQGLANSEWLVVIARFTTAGIRGLVSNLR
jgi:hypothetical protein